MTRPTCTTSPRGTAVDSVTTTGTLFATNTDVARFIDTVPRGAIVTVRVRVGIVSARPVVAKLNMNDPADKQHTKRKGQSVKRHHQMHR